MKYTKQICYGVIIGLVVALVPCISLAFNVENSGCSWINKKQVERSGPQIVINGDRNVAIIAPCQKIEKAAPNTEYVPMETTTPQSNNKNAGGREESYQQ